MHSLPHDETAGTGCDGVCEFRNRRYSDRGDCREWNRRADAPCDRRRPHARGPSARGSGSRWACAPEVGTCVPEVGTCPGMGLDFLGGRPHTCRTCLRLRVRVRVVDERGHELAAAASCPTDCVHESTTAARRGGSSHLDPAEIPRPALSESARNPGRGGRPPRPSPGRPDRRKTSWQVGLAGTASSPQVAPAQDRPMVGRSLGAGPEPPTGRPEHPAQGWQPAWPARPRLASRICRRSG